MKKRIKEGVINQREFEWVLKFIYMFGELELYITINEETEKLYDKFKNRSGVYMINNFYIGKSKNIIKRIIEHILEVHESEQPNFRPNTKNNKDKINAMNKILNGTNKLNITIISDNQTDEIKLIQEYQLKKFPLTNKTGMLTK